MKKLTAGIFTVLMGLVSVNAADAAVASKGYVDKLDRVQGGLVATNTQNITKNAEDIAKNAENITKNAGDIAKNAGNITKNAEDIAKNAGKIGGATFTEDTLKYVKGETDLTAAVKKLDAAVTVASGDLTNVYTKNEADAKFIDTDEITGYATDGELTNVSDVANAADSLSKTNKDAITLLNSDENTVGSVAQKIKTVTTAYQAADATTLESANAYTDAEVKELSDGAVAANTAAIAAINNETTGALATAKKYADDQDAAQTTTITNEYQAADTATLNSAKAYTDAAGTAAKAYAKTYTDQKVAGLNLAEISRVPAECGNPGNYCTLTTNGTNFVWEVIARGDAADEEAPSTAEGASRLQVTVPGVTEPTVTQ